ncbi:phage tail protein, partial [Lactobacillus jensenii]
ITQVLGLKASEKKKLEEADVDDLQDTATLLCHKILGTEDIEPDEADLKSTNRPKNKKASKSSR